MEVRMLPVCYLKETNNSTALVNALSISEVQTFQNTTLCINNQDAWVFCNPLFGHPKFHTKII